MKTSSIPNAADGYLVYDGKAIRRRGGLLNLTSMWHAIGRPPNRRPRDWLALPETERFVLHLRNAPPASPGAIIADIAGLSSIRNIDADFLFVTTHERKRALWAHWHIALPYAQYLDPAFHAWCLEVIRDSLERLSAPSAPPLAPLLDYLEDQLARLHERFDIIDRHAGDLLFLVTAAQDLVLGNRRMFSERSQVILCKVVVMEPFAGRCPCCRMTPVLSSNGTPAAGAQFDHFFHRGLNRPELGWLICERCHRDLSYGGYLMRFSKLAAFRTFQAAVLAFKQAQHQSPDPTS